MEIPSEDNRFQAHARMCGSNDARVGAGNDGMRRSTTSRPAGDKRGGTEHSPVDSPPASDSGANDHDHDRRTENGTSVGGRLLN
jgi:hypothetical protein